MMKKKKEDKQVLNKTRILKIARYQTSVQHNMLDEKVTNKDSCDDSRGRTNLNKKETKIMNKVKARQMETNSKSKVS